MKPKVLVPGPMLAVMKGLLEGHVSIEGGTEKLMDRQTVLSRIRDADGLILTGGFKADSHLMERASNLKVISTNSVGYDHIDVEEATRLGIYVCNTPGVLTDCVAETACGLMCAATKRLAEGDRFVRAGNWRMPLGFDEFLGQDLKRRVLGIVGLGRIGKRVADMARCLGMEVIYYDVARSEAAELSGIAYRDLDSLMTEADIVSIHVPLTGDTRHLVDRRRIGLMKKDSVLINTSRGAVVDEQALIEALEQNKIGSAGLDVFEEEPLPLGSRLLRLENVVLSPHRGSSSVETRAAMSELAARNLLAVLRGWMPPALVNEAVLKVRPLDKVRML